MTAVLPIELPIQCVVMITMGEFNVTDHSCCRELRNTVTNEQ